MEVTQQAGGWAAPSEDLEGTLDFRNRSTFWRACSKPSDCDPVRPWCLLVAAGALDPLLAPALSQF